MCKTNIPEHNKFEGAQKYLWGHCTRIPFVATDLCCSQSLHTKKLLLYWK